MNLVNRTARKHGLPRNGVTSCNHANSTRPFPCPCFLLVPPIGCLRLAVHVYCVQLSTLNLLQLSLSLSFYKVKVTDTHTQYLPFTQQHLQPRSIFDIHSGIPPFSLFFPSLSLSPSLFFLILLNSLTFTLPTTYVV